MKIYPVTRYLILQSHCMVLYTVHVATLNEIAINKRSTMVVQSNGHCTIFQIEVKKKLIYFGRLLDGRCLLRLLQDVYVCVCVWGGCSFFLSLGPNVTVDPSRAYKVCFNNASEISTVLNLTGDTVASCGAIMWCMTYTSRNWSVIVAKWH